MKESTFTWLVWASGWFGGVFVFGGKPLWSVILGFSIAIGGYAFLIYNQDKSSQKEKTQ